MLEIVINPEGKGDAPAPSGDEYAEIGKALKTYEAAVKAGEWSKAARAFCAALDLHAGRGKGDY